MKFGNYWPMGFREEDFTNNGHIHVLSPGAGTDNPLESFFINSIIQTI